LPKGASALGPAEAVGEFLRPEFDSRVRGVYMFPISAFHLSWRYFLNSYSSW
jgi:hypothetical protein